MKFGLVAGVNRSNQLTNRAIDYYMTGFEVGITGEVNLSRHFFLFPQLVLIKKGADSYTGSHWSFLYLNLHVRASSDHSSARSTCVPFPHIILR